VIGVVKGRSTCANIPVAGVIVGDGSTPGGADGYDGLLARDGASQGVGRDKNQGYECCGEGRHRD